MSERNYKIGIFCHSFNELFSNVSVAWRIVWGVGLLSPGALVACDMRCWLQMRDVSRPSVTTDDRHGSHYFSRRWSLVYGSQS